MKRFSRATVSATDLVLNLVMTEDWAFSNVRLPPSLYKPFWRGDRQVLEPCRGSSPGSSRPIIDAHNHDGLASSIAMYRRSVLDVEGVAEGLVEPDPAVDVELPNGFRVEKYGGNRDQVVAADDALIRKALVRPDLNFRADTTHSSRDGCTRDRGEDNDRGVTGEDADGPPPGGWSQVGPYDVAPLYHSGAVSEASREAAETMAGSCGTLR